MLRKLDSVSHTAAQRRADHRVVERPVVIRSATASEAIRGEPGTPGAALRDVGLSLSACECSVAAQGALSRVAPSGCGSARERLHRPVFRGDGRRVGADDFGQRVAAGAQQRRGEVVLDGSRPGRAPCRSAPNRAGSGWRRRGSWSARRRRNRCRRRRSAETRPRRAHRFPPPSASTAGTAAGRDSPPCSFARACSRRRMRRDSVVLATIMPSTLRERAMCTTSSSSFKRQIGRDLQQHRGVAGIGAHPLAGVDHLGQQIVERRGLLQIAQARRVRRRDVDGEVARHRREGLDQPHIVGDAIRRNPCWRRH